MRASRHRRGRRGKPNASRRTAAKCAMFSHGKRRASGGATVTCAEKKLKTLTTSIDQNTGIVESKLARADDGEIINPAFVVSAAKYYAALKELADE